MIYETKTITLKDGRAATLRAPALTDAAEMLAYIKTCCAETDFLARYPEEYGDSVEIEEAWIRRMVESPTVLPMVCEVEGRIAGSCEVRFFGGIKTSHRAILAISILREFWNLGIGTALMTELIAASRAHGTEILELDFIEGNTRAQRLYEKMGFAIVGFKRNAFKLKDGTYLGEFSMQKLL